MRQQSQNQHHGPGTVVSDLTHDSGGSSAQSGTTPAKARHLVHNMPGVNPIFATFMRKINSIKIAQAIATAGSDPPSITRGGQSTPMCCVWHLKGLCWANCPRAADHDKDFKEEDKLLLLWAYV
jgi:hypothetical protein